MQSTDHIINIKLPEIRPLSRQTVLIAPSFHSEGGPVHGVPLDGLVLKTNTNEHWDIVEGGGNDG